jgi:hypothetical protein
MLFSLYAVLGLLAQNKGDIPLSQAGRSLILLPLAALLVLLILRTLLREWPRAALLTAIFVLVGTSYGHVYSTLEGFQIGGAILGRHRYLLPLTAALLGLAIWRIALRRPDTRLANQFLTVTAAVLLVFPAYDLVSYRLNIQDRGDPQSLDAIMQQLQLEPPTDAPLPDVYYIILDGYARSDYMLESIGYDNSDFIDYLQSKGFYVAEKSHSNHNWTSLSISSSLNMTFAQDLGLNLVWGTYPGIFTGRIRDSIVRQMLTDLGYMTVGVRSGYMNTELINAERYLSPDEVDLEKLKQPLSLNAFEGMLLRSSLGLVLWDLTIGDVQTWTRMRTSTPYDLLRQIILYQFETLPEIAAMPEPTFAFLHIVAPHSPYLFNRNGEPIEPSDPFTFVEPAEVNLESNSAALYRDQAIFITGKVQEAVEAILARSETTPIIILQADHGSGVVPGWQDRSGEGMRQRMSIFNAYLLPERCAADLYPEITPVNSFRVVFNCVYGGNIPLLEDRVYNSPWPYEYNYYFNDVTDVVD